MLKNFLFCLSKRCRLIALMVFCLAGLPIGFSEVTQQSRIVQPSDSGQTTILQGNIPAKARLQYDQGSVSPDMQIQGVSLAFKLSSSQQTALQQLLAEQRNPSSANYHKWLTPEQYAARFGMSQDDLDKVSSWLQSQGFGGIRISRGHNEISFDGSAAQIESAFRTPIHRYLVNGEMHFANSAAPAVPAAFANVALGLRRLNDFRPQARARKFVAHFTSAETGNHFITPGDFATIYDLPVSSDGTGITIVVAGQTQLGTTPTDVSDVNTFRTLSGLSSNPPQLLLLTGSGTSTLSSSDVDEANLDVEWSGGVATGATVVYEYVGNAPNFSVFDAWQDAVDSDRGAIVSISYGLCEADFGSTTELVAQQVAQQANAQGQTLTAAAGDAGAADCDGDDATPATVAVKGLSVDVPAAVPEVTGVGSTEFNGDVAGAVTGTAPNTNGGATTYWGGTAGGNDQVSSALSYIPEMAWNDSPVTGTGPLLSSFLFASGGGASAVFSKPSWQTGTGVPNDNSRDVPDVALAGSPNHDGFLICSQGWCNNGFSNSNSTPDPNELDVVGGTSVDAMAFGGILAVLNQGTHSNGLGNVNPTLYTLAANSSASIAFHDTTLGNNFVPCTAGTVNCPTSGAAQFGYSAGAGYDLVTGLGSVDVVSLITAWQGISPSADFSIEGLQTAVSAAGVTGSSTITLESMYGFSGAVALSCALTPASSTAEITCGFTAPTSGSTTSVTVNGSSAATATLSIATTAATSSADARPRGRFGWLGASGGALFVGIFVIGVPMRRRRWTALLGLVFCSLLVTGVGCAGGSSSGGNGSSGGGGTTTNPGTPAGNYVIMVTGTSGGVSHSANVAITVQ
jgi:pseudomonalisin